jgi:rare lipoprotein A
MKFSAKTLTILTVVGISAVTGSAEAGQKGNTSGPKASSGAASWYGGQFHGRTTANGERYDMNGLTAAHRSLPFGTKVRVTNQENGKSVVVRINDRGPYVGKRVIDLSRGAAQKVSMLGSGVAPVRLEVVN